MDFAPLIARYESAGQSLRDAVAGLSREQLVKHPVPGTWSIQEIVIHLMDSDLIGIDRMKRIIAEDKPLLIGYNETRFIQSLHPRLQDIQDAITILNLSRKLFAKVLRALPPEAYDRVGIHNEAGKVSLGSQLQKYCEHFEHHLKFIVQKSAMVRK